METTSLHAKSTNSRSKWWWRWNKSRLVACNNLKGAIYLHNPMVCQTVYGRGFAYVQFTSYRYDSFVTKTNSSWRYQCWCMYTSRTYIVMYTHTPTHTMHSAFETLIKLVAKSGAKWDGASESLTHGMPGSSVYCCCCILRLSAICTYWYD